METVLSVIIPTYYRPALLHRCLLALFRQDISKELFEVIVVSDGEDENTSNAIQKFKKDRNDFRLHYFSLSEKRGPAAARNLGWRSANGRYILFTDDDCVPDVDWIGSYYEAFLKTINQDLIVFTGKVHVPISSYPTDFEKNTAQLSTAHFITANCACTKSAIEMFNGFDERFTMAWREDSDLEYRFRKAGIPIHKIESAVVVHPVRAAPWGVSLKEQKKSMFDALLFKKHPNFFRQENDLKILKFYAVVVIVFIVFLISFFMGKWSAGFIFFFVWALLIGWFAKYRLENTDHSLGHILEMIYTSALIPFVSLYWNLYGAFKFKLFKND